MSATLIKGAYVLTMDEGLGSMSDCDVLIRDELIAEVGPGLDAPDAEVVDGRGRVVMPGLVDCHRHMFSGMLRGGCSNVTYTGKSGGYFEVVIRQYGGSFTPDDSRMSSRIGALESINSGITTLHAWEHNIMSVDHGRASLEGMADTGLRGRFSYGPPNDTQVVDLDGVLALRDELFSRGAGGRWEADDGRWHLGVATRGVETRHPEVWQREAEFARQEGLPLTAHLMQEGDVRDLKEKDVLGPDLMVCHALGASESEMADLRETGTPVCVSTPAVARAGLRASPVTELMRAGVLVCLSIDSTAGCDTADMFALMRITMIVERTRHEDAGVYSTHDALRQATIDGARGLGLGDVTGSLTPGKRADVIVVNTAAINLTPWTVPETLLASCVYPENVEAVFVDGRCLKRDGALVEVDMDTAIAEANDQFQSLQDRVGVPFE
jgi:5-methylthioadenosine/S-adenosylhomocysteine deaminase